MQAKNLHYGFDFCPAFWDWLITRNQAGVVFSIAKVHDDIRAGNDDLTRWAALRGDQFFLRPDAALASALGTVSTWAASAQYEQAAVSTFLQASDSYLVAHALALRYTVVTHEKPANSRTRIKIPNACNGVAINCITPFQMLRNEGARFVLPVPV